MTYIITRQLQLRIRSNCEQRYQRKRAWKWNLKSVVDFCDLPLHWQGQWPWLLQPPWPRRVDSTWSPKTWGICSPAAIKIPALSNYLLHVFSPAKLGKKSTRRSGDVSESKPPSPRACSGQRFRGAAAPAEWRDPRGCISDSQTPPRGGCSPAEKIGKAADSVSWVEQHNSLAQLFLRKLPTSTTCMYVTSSMPLRLYVSLGWCSNS